MDSRESVISALKALYSQPCLTALANAGEYKRALKELQGASPRITFENGAFVVAVGGETVTLGEKRESFRCTCPSPVICRHILAAIMAVSDSEETSVEEKEAEAPAAELKKEDIISAVGEKIYRSALKRYASANIEITSAQPLCAVVNGHKTAFLTGFSGESVCSCKKSACEHRALALLKVWSDTTGEAVVADFEPPDENTLKLIDGCLSLLSGLLERGLYSATVVDSQLLMFYSLNLSKYAQVLGRNLRSLSLLLDEVLENKIFTENARLTYHFCKAFNILSAVFRNKDNGDILARILEDGSKSYKPVAEQSFVSLGYYPFLTESGYAGVTHLLAGEEGVLSLSSVLPTVYDDYDDGELAELVKGQYSNVFASLAGQRVALTNFKSNGARINISENTSVMGKGTAVDDLPSLSVYESSYGALEQAGKERDYFGIRSANCFVIPYDFLEAELNEYGVAEAEFSFGGKRLTAYLGLNAVTRAACELLTAEKRKNGFAVLETYDGVYFLRSLFEKGAAVNIYSPEDENKKGGKKK